MLSCLLPCSVGCPLPPPSPLQFSCKRSSAILVPSAMLGCSQQCVVETHSSENQQQMRTVEAARKARKQEYVGSGGGNGLAPVFLFDVMGTIVRDPFYDDVPAFFGLTMKELLTIKHPTAWIKFENGLLTEDDLLRNFFIDGRDFNFAGLKSCVASGYKYIEGIEAVLCALKSEGYQMHAFTNYPPWYKMIEEKLKLSQYLAWTFVSCCTGRRKPDPEAYVEAAQYLGLRPSDCIFIDDQPRNVEVASSIGMVGIIFQDAHKLEKDLETLGILVQH